MKEMCKPPNIEIVVVSPKQNLRNIHCLSWFSEHMFGLIKNGIDVKSNVKPGEPGSPGGPATPGSPGSPEGTIK